ncbi:MAG: hypothetical protein ACXVY8_06225, partial [Gaiellaceae bacterium]
MSASDGVRRSVCKRLGLGGSVAAMALVGVAAGLGASTAQAGASAAASTGVIVAESGRITLHGESLRIGGSTANDVRRAEGGKPTSSMGLMGRMG